MVPAQAWVQVVKTDHHFLVDQWEDQEDRAEAVPWAQVVRWDQMDQWALADLWVEALWVEARLTQVECPEA